MSWHANPEILPAAGYTRYTPAVPGCCILDRARTAAGFHRAAAWSESDRVVPQWCGNRLLCAFALIISVYSVNSVTTPVISVATPMVYNSAPQSVSFFANYEEFPARHTAPLADGYRRQARLCDVWLRLRRAGKSAAFYCLQIKRSGEKPPRRARGKPPARMKCIEHRAFGIEHLDFGTGIFTCRTRLPLQFAGDHRTSVTHYWLLLVARCFPARRDSFLPVPPGLVAPRIRVIRLESLPRARRGGPSRPAGKPNRFAIADTRRTHKSVCPLLPECAGIQYSLVIFS